MISYQTASGRVWLGGRAALLDDGAAGVKAWAEKHVRRDGDIRWMIGNYVEADVPNSNGHIFPLADLQDYGMATLPNKSLNMLHHGHYIVGSTVAGEMVDNGPQADDAPGQVVELLAGMWHRVFPNEVGLIERAHNEGTLFFSHETFPGKIECPEVGCGVTSAWEGFESENYCAHMNASRVSQKILHEPHFNAAAIIVPPARPGWSRADVKDMSAVLQQHADEAEAVYAGLQEEAPHLGPAEWERLMAEIILMAEGPRPD